MPASPLDLVALLAPLDAAAPSGPDLAHDPEFIALEQAGAGKPETQWAAAVPADWPAVHEMAQRLARRTRDLRVAVWLLRSAARLSGLGGAADGLALIRGLLEQLWDTVHPQLDAEDNLDPTMRMNALAPLGAREAALADLRAAALAPVRGSLRLRDLELGLGRAEPAVDETTPTEAGVRQALSELLSAHPDAAPTCARCVSDARAIDALLQAKVGAQRAPELAPLLDLLGMLGDAVARASGAPGGEAGAQAASAGADAAAPSAGGAGGAAGAIRTRSDAMRELDRVCEWIERNEPSNPAPLLIRRAKRLMDKSFLEIVRDLAPDGLPQAERIAGAEIQR